MAGPEQRGEAGMRRAAVVVASAGGAMLGVLAARTLLAAPPGAGISFLMAIPIALVAHELGRRAGLTAAALALGLVVLWVWVDHVDLTPAGYLTRAAIFCLVAVLAARRTEPVSAPQPPAASASPVQAPPSPPSPLSPREQEVLALLAAGHTNREIAGHLVVSIRTVETHRANIRSKLGASGRAELVRHAAELRLLEPSGA